MRCVKARELLSDRHNGDISPRSAEGLRNHLTGCAACREAAGELEEMLQLLGSCPTPTLPEGFGEALDARLEADGQDRPFEGKPEPAVSRPGWVTALGGAGLVAAGAAAVLLIVWATSSPGPSPPVRCEAPGHVRGTGAAAVNTSLAKSPPDSARRLRVGQVAVLVLSIRAEGSHAKARLQVVLPDGVTLLGDGEKDLKEKHMEWVASLVPGENEIRIPVRAQRVGTWRLVARAQASGFRAISEARLVVTRS
jgi:Putative zinc-finger